MKMELPSFNGDVTIEEFLDWALNWKGYLLIWRLQKIKRLG